MWDKTEPQLGQFRFEQPLLLLGEAEMRAHRPLGELGVRSPGLVAVLMACLVKGENKQTNKTKQRYTDLQDKEQPLKERGGYCVVSY